MAQPTFPPGSPSGPYGAQHAGMQPVTRRGVSKIIPVLVAIAVAAGTFSGLYFGLGTGSGDDELDPHDGVGEVDRGAAVPGAGTGTAAVAAGGAAAPSGGSVDPAVAVDATPVGLDAPVAGGGDTAALAADAAPEPTVAPDGALPPVEMTKLMVIFKPSADGAAITVDGQAVTGNRYELEVPAGTKPTISVVAKLSGHRVFERSYTIDGDMEIPIKLERASAGTKPRPASAGTKPRSERNRGKRPPPDRIDL